MAQAGTLWPGAVAVSGGGDSLALTLLLADWAKAGHKPLPIILVVDHGLRKASAGEARGVIARARALGLSARTLRWVGPKPGTNIEALAREARYRLMGGWCQKNGIQNLYVAHTLEDQAETFLIRLARGSGIDGLAGMSTVSPLPLEEFADISLVRPLLGFRRSQLRDLLLSRGEKWLEDPMNNDPRFARARVRAASPILETIGLTPPRISAAAHHLARAREALAREAAAVESQVCLLAEGSARIDSARLTQAPEEIGLRVLTGALQHVSGRAFRPRFERLERLYALLRWDKLGGGRTLHGCRVVPAKKADALFGPGTISIFREDRRRVSAVRGNISRNSGQN